MRVCYTSLIFGGLLFLLLCEFQNLQLLLNYGVGLLIGLLFVYVTGMLVTESIFKCGSRWSSWLISFLTVAKYALLILALYTLTRYGAMNPAGLLIGLSTAPAVLVLKLIGQSYVGSRRKAVDQHHAGCDAIRHMGGVDKA